MSLDTNQDVGVYSKGFTFVQLTTPTINIEIGDTWMNPNTGFIKICNRFKHWVPYSSGKIGGPGADYGYCCGGYSGTAYLSSIDRITFPFDSGTAKNVNNMNNNRSASTACNSSNYGYLIAGVLTDIDRLSSIERITFPFDSGSSVLVGNVMIEKYQAQGCNSSNHGYSMGGATISEIISFIDCITFPFDSGTASRVGNLSGINYFSAGCNSSNHGYNMGGNNGIGSAYLSVIDRIAFPFNSGVALHVGNLTMAFYALAACNSSSYGYSMGGFDGVNIISIIDRITFPFNSGTASRVGNLPSFKAHITGCNSSNHGYNMGGVIGPFISSIDRITFPFDSGTATYVGNLSGILHSGSGIDGVDFTTLFV